jgi:phosphohistidine phosphatase SixA
MTPALRRWLLTALLTAVALPLALPAAAQTANAAAATAAGELQGAALLAALRRGGYILYFRHASTDFGQNDERMSGYEDCATQRNLTDKGRAEARAIGAAIGALKLPVDTVLASPYCRTLDTARLIFGRAQASTAVRGGPASADDARYAELRTLLSTPPAAGTNVAIVSHGNPYRAVVGGSYLAEGEAAVIAPLGAKGFRVVARIPRDDWGTLQ